MTKKNLQNQKSTLANESEISDTRKHTRNKHTNREKYILDTNTYKYIRNESEGDPETRDYVGIFNFIYGGSKSFFRWGSIAGPQLIERTGGEQISLAKARFSRSYLERPNDTRSLFDAEPRSRQKARS